MFQLSHSKVVFCRYGVTLRIYQSNGREKTGCRCFKDDELTPFDFDIVAGLHCNLAMPIKMDHGAE